MNNENLKKICSERKYLIKGTNRVEPNVIEQFKESSKESLLEEASRLLAEVSELSTNSNDGFDLLKLPIENFEKLVCYILNHIDSSSISIPYSFTDEEENMLLKPVSIYYCKEFNKDTPTEMGR